MSDQPNILFIFLDQMRYDCLSILGHPAIDTPNIDQIGHRGVVFESAYTPCPSCIAARASLWTGLTPSTHGRLGYRDRVPWNYEDMLPDLLGKAGYQTHCVGKTHFYPQRSHQGFHSLDSYEAAQNFDGLFVNDYHEWLSEKSDGRLREYDHGLDSNSWNARPSHLPEELHNNTWVVTKGIDFIRRRDKSRPFFLNLSFHRPHPPIDPPQVFFDMYRDRPLPPVPVGDWAGSNDVEIDDLNAWHGRLPERSLDQMRRAYYAQVAHIDSQIGRMLLALKHLKAGPTAIVFSADHGEMLGDHHMLRKTYAYEGSAAVPLLISVPDGFQNRRCDAPATLEDLYPTILDIADAPVPSRTEGQSLMQFVTDTPKTGWREFVHGEHSACYSREEAMQFLTDGKEKYIWFTITGQERLFDLTEDPQECRDLASDPKEKSRLAVWRTRMIERLAERPQDGLSDGKRLIEGTALPSVRPGLVG